MSTTFLRGLAMLEAVGVHGPLSIGALARAVDADKATVSRMVTAAAADGWLVRTPGGVALGPRLPVLAHTSELTGELGRAQTLVDAVAGVTGLFTQAYLAVGRGIVPVVSAGRAPIALPRPPGLELPIWSIAAGRALATLLPHATVESLLGGATDSRSLPGVAEVVTVGEAVADGLGEPAADPPAGSTMTAARFLAAVEEIRRSGVAYDHGDVHPLVHCIAVPWPGFTEPAGVCVIGLPDEVASGARVAEAVLRELTEPGATRERIVQRAAEVSGSGGSSGGANG